MGLNMKIRSKAFIIAALLTIIPLTGVMVNNHHQSPELAIPPTHQVETNLTEPRLLVEDPIVTLQLTPFNNPEGINSSGLILLDLKIEQTELEQVSEVGVKIDQEGDDVWINIYNGGFVDELELNLRYGFTELVNGVHTIEVVVKLKDSISPELTFTEAVQISTNEQGIIGINKQSMVIDPTVNEDGTTTYSEGSIQVRLQPHQKMFDFGKVDATNAKFRIFHDHNAFVTIGIDYDQNAATATSNETVIIPTTIEQPHYLITLTGIEYDSVPIGSIEVTTSMELTDGSHDVVQPGVSFEPMSGETITKLVIVLVFVLIFLGFGISWALKD